MTKRIIDSNGFVEIPDNPLSKVGIYDYLGSEIGAPEPGRMYKVLRPEDELSRLETVQSFKGMPLVNDHTMIGDGNTAPEDKGIDGVIGDNVYYRDGTLFGNLRLYTNKIKDLINKAKEGNPNGKKDLSLGYYARYEYSPGTWRGQAYDYVQRFITGNHIALVKDGRCGDSVAVLDQYPLVATFDHLTIIDSNNPNPTKEAQPMATTEEVTKIVTDALAPVLATMDAMNKRLAAMDEEADDKDKEDDKKATEDEESKADDKDDKKATEDESEDKKETMDANAIEALVKRAVQDSNAALLADLKAKNELVELSLPLVGTFDHSTMKAADVAKYTANKLGLEGDPVTAVKTYAKAMQLGGKTTPVMDAKAHETQLKAGEFN